METALVPEPGLPRPPGMGMVEPPIQSVMLPTMPQKRSFTPLFPTRTMEITRSAEKAAASIFHSSMSIVWENFYK